MGAVAKSYMTKGCLIYEEIRKHNHIQEEAVSHIWLCNCFLLNFLILYMRKIWLSFLSVLISNARKTEKNGWNLNGDYQLRCNFVLHSLLTQGASLRQYIGAGIYVLYEYISLSFYLHSLSYLRFPVSPSPSPSSSSSLSHSVSQLRKIIQKG